MTELKKTLAEIKGMLLDKQNKKKKVKKWRFPFGKKTSINQARRGYVTVFKINENGFINPSKELIQEQTVMIDDIPRLATPDYILHIKKSPLMFLPTWSVKPLTKEKLATFDIEESQKESLDDGSNTKGYKILMARMKSETVNPKKKISGMVKWIAGLAIAGIIGYALLTGGG